MDLFSHTPAAVNQASPRLHALPDPQSTSSKSDELAIRLIFQISQQDRFSLDTLYELWSQSLLGIAMRTLGQREEAEEVLQDTFVKIWHRAAEYDPTRSKPFVWAFTILRSLCIDHIRHHHRQKRDKSKITSLDTHEIPNYTAEPIIFSRDTFHEVRQAMAQLPPEERRCIELAVFLEYTHSEISNHLQTPLGTVKNRLRRALGKMQQLLSDYEI